MRLNPVKLLFCVSLSASGIALATSAGAQDLLSRAKAGETIRIGFANEVPWAYPGDNNKPLGFVNAIALGVLKQMGITKVEPVVTEWGGLIPGLKANRFDIITGGMYILKSRLNSEYNLTMLMLTHQMGFAKDISDRICFFYEGRIAEQGRPDQIYGSPENKRTRQFLSAVLEAS